MKVSGLCGLDATLRSVRTARRAALAVEEMARADVEISDLFDEIHRTLADEELPDDVDKAWGY